MAFKVVYNSKLRGHPVYSREFETREEAQTYLEMIKEMGEDQFRSLSATDKGYGVREFEPEQIWVLDLSEDPPPWIND